MGKAKRKTTATRHAKAAPEPGAEPTTGGTVRMIVLVAVLAAVPFMAGKYLELGTPGPFDSAANVHSAWRIHHGAKIGVDEMPSAQIGTLLVNILGVAIFGFNEIGPKLIQGLCQAAALIMMFLAMRKLFGLLAAGAAVVIASLYLSAPVIAKFGNVKEQFLIAFMVLGVSCLILRQLGGRWWWAVLSGAALIWAPLFKETGLSALGAVGLFVLIQPVRKHRTWKQTGTDILLLAAGMAAGLAPVFLWLAAVGAPATYMPFASLLRFVAPAKTSQAASPGYLSGSRALISMAELFPRVMRYYGLLILPILLAIGALVARLVRGVMNRFVGTPGRYAKRYDRFVPLLAVWWLLDMAFVWVSPRSYEQYYLPLSASGAMLGAYLVAIWAEAWRAGNRRVWGAVGAGAGLAAVYLAWPIVFGLTHSPHSAAAYPEKTRGYVQRLAEVAKKHRTNRLGAWEAAGDYIREHSSPTDTIYVWGWYPGVYVRAQRIACVPKAYEGNMHIMSPAALGDVAAELVASFQAKRPKFLVDSHKLHFPWNRPPLEFWPIHQQRPLPNDPATIAQYEAGYGKALAENVDPVEAERFKAMKPLRDYVMANYKPAKAFGGQVVMVRRDAP